MRDKNEQDLLNERRFFSRQIQQLFNNERMQLNKDISNDPNFGAYLNTANFDDVREKKDEIFDEYQPIRDAVIKASTSIKALMLYKVALVEHKTTYGDVTNSIMKLKSEANVASMKQLLIDHHIKPDWISKCENGDKNFDVPLIQEFMKNDYEPMFRVVKNIPNCSLKEINNILLTNLNQEVRIEKEFINEEDEKVLSSYLGKKETASFPLHGQTGTKQNLFLDLIDIKGLSEKVPANTITKHITEFCFSDDKEKIGKSVVNSPLLNDDGSKTIITTQYVSEREYKARKKNGALQEFDKYTTTAPISDLALKKVLSEKDAEKKRKEIQKDRAYLSAATSVEDLDERMKKISEPPYYYHNPGDPKLAFRAKSKYNYRINIVKTYDNYPKREFNKKDSIKQQKFSCYEWKDNKFVLKQPKGIFEKFKFFFTKLFNKSSEDKLIESLSTFKTSINEISQKEKEDFQYLNDEIKESISDINKTKKQATKKLVNFGNDLDNELGNIMSKYDDIDTKEIEADVKESNQNVKNIKNEYENEKVL